MQLMSLTVLGSLAIPVSTYSRTNYNDFFDEETGTIHIKKGDMKNMILKGNRIILDFEMPSRGIIGLRTEMITATSGEAIMAHRFIKYEPHKGEIQGRLGGSMISKETGEAIAYSLDKLQDRGKFFIEPNDEIYTGMVVGENSRGGDMMINCTVTKKLTNVRASGTDDKIRLAPVVKFTLEEALEYIQGDEYVEVTPKSIRIRKIYLDENETKI